MCFISFFEFEIDLSSGNSKSPEPDGIPFSFIYNLPKCGKLLLLKIYINIWNSGTILSEWINFLIIPIFKIGKNKFSPTGYGPISLLNSMCELIEKMINHRLMWSIEKINYKKINTTWRRRIIANLLNETVKFYYQFFYRSFQIKHNSTLYEKLVQQNGVPKGSTLSVTIFIRN